MKLESLSVRVITAYRSSIRLCQKSVKCIPDKGPEPTDVPLHLLATNDPLTRFHHRRELTTRHLMFSGLTTRSRCDL